MILPDDGGKQSHLRRPIVRIAADPGRNAWCLAETTIARTLAWNHAAKVNKGITLEGDDISELFHAGRDQRTKIVKRVYTEL